jgi:integrase/recombinase XerD
MKKLRKPILEKEFRTLINYVQNNSTMRDNTRENYIRLFALLYYTGARVNEIPSLHVKDIFTALENKELIINAHKQKKQRLVQLSTQAIKELEKLFKDDNPSHRVIKVKGNPFATPSNISFISAVNKTIQSVLGTHYSSHSFRSGVITELGTKGVNPKIIQEFIGHKNVTTTMNYIKPSKDDIRNALLR